MTASIASLDLGAIRPPSRPDAARHDDRCRPDLAATGGPRRLRRRDRPLGATGGTGCSSSRCSSCRTSRRSATWRARGSAPSPTTCSTSWAPGFIVLAIGALARLGRDPAGAAILIAHVGMDRAVGYGLKLPSSFHDTHLGRMGARRRESRAGTDIRSSRSSPPAESCSRPAASTRSRCRRSPSESASGPRRCTSGSRTAAR